MIFKRQQNTTPSFLKTEKKKGTEMYKNLDDEEKNIKTQAKLKH